MSTLTTPTGDGAVYAVARGKPEDPWTALYRYDELTGKLLRFLHGEWFPFDNFDVKQFERALKKGELMRFDSRDLVVPTVRERYVGAQAVGVSSLTSLSDARRFIFSLLRFDDEWYVLESSSVRPVGRDDLIVTADKSWPIHASNPLEQVLIRMLAVHIKSRLDLLTVRIDENHRGTVRSSLGAYTKTVEELRSAAEKERAAAEAERLRIAREQPAVLTNDEFAEFMRKMMGGG